MTIAVVYVGKPGKIIHNYLEPYKIAFLCDNCRKDKTNYNNIENYRINIEEIIERKVKKDVSNKHMSRLPVEDIKHIVDEYLKFTGSIGEYCTEKEISRHQFGTMVNIYASEYTSIPIKAIVKNKSKMIQKQIVTRAKMKI